MEAFGFELTLQGEIEDGKWRSGREHNTGRMARVDATGHGYEIAFLVKEDSDTGRILPEVALVWPMDGVLEEVRHKFPIYTEGFECGGRLCHELRVPTSAETGDATEERISDLGLMLMASPDFLDEMERLGIDLALYEEAVESPAAPAHARNFCAVLPTRDPLLVCAVFIGEKVVPWLLAAG